MKYSIHIEKDTDCYVHPRKDCDNLATMYCDHLNYELGDEQCGGDELLERLFREQRDNETYGDWRRRGMKYMDAFYIHLPLYLYDHGGIIISTSPFSCSWDSGKVGVILVSKKDIYKEYNVKLINKTLREKVIGILEAEVKEYDDYLTGNVWGYIIKDENEEEVESCWGFVGDEKYCREEAEVVVKLLLQRDRKTHYEQLKAWIKNKVSLIYRTPCIQ